MDEQWKAARPEWLAVEGGEEWLAVVEESLAGWLRGEVGMATESVMRTAAMLEWAWRHDAASRDLTAQAVCVEGRRGGTWALVGVATEAWPQRLIVLAMRQLVGDRAPDVIAALPAEVRAGWLDEWLAEVDP
jgi:hypothetical protein